MQIGIIGLGVVGSACKAGFERCGYNVVTHDIKLDTTLSELMDTEIVYICVPTPSADDNSCDTSIVESVIEELQNLEYMGIIAIKSTVPPGFTQSMIDLYNDNIVFVPEFLKERSAEYDFIFNQKILVVGTENINNYYVVVRSHGDMPKQSSQVRPGEAELIKYYHNTFNAARVVFANVLYEISHSLGMDYSVVKRLFLVTSNMPDEYLDVSDILRGYGGVCLTKDVLAMQKFCDDHNLPYSLFENIHLENEKFQTTIFDGMRDK